VKNRGQKEDEINFEKKNAILKEVGKNIKIKTG
jgi:hypothetical protein